MSEMTEAPRVAAAPRLPGWAKPLAFALLPVLAALLAGALVLWALGSDPLNYYTYVVERGLLRTRGLQASIVHMIPLLILGTALIVSFRAGLWNLGIDGQYILGTLTAGVVAPKLVAVMPVVPALFLAMLAGAAVGALWALPPALLRAKHGINEVISGLMMSFMATSLAAAIIKLWAKDPASLEPQTSTIPVEQRLPLLPGTDINLGIVIALVVTIAAHLAISRTSAGLKLRILGLNPAAATHAGLPAPRMIVLVLCLSGAIGGFAGAVELTGVLGKMQASWNPAYGFAVVPLVFLARMNGWAMIAFVFAFSVLSIGGASAAVRLGVPQSFTMVLVGFLLLFLALAEWIDQTRREQA
ncbi:putative B6 ABC transporter permease subunit 2 [Pseudooceanicola nanhaiensis]|uniref:putative B6 ABC transporter permease subunit 2 n=1 Tax=Pseudooceanicola nanhaiensis TaxID=375761 RepID=UPI001CD6014F|nr:ABC transporter permease [Pseudooceanicola nanhaiensis]MCA0921280.1 ABC transporter permease [Pseudooceanicola nanhaiensis]